MKKYLKLIGFSLILVLFYSVNAFAETKETTLNLDKDYTNAVFSISWENVDKTGSVELISPDGTIYSEAKTPDDVYEAKGEAIINIGKPAKGEWKIKVTGDNLGKVKIEVGQIPNSMIIDAFTVKANGDKYTADYSISDCPENVTLEVFADTDGKDFDGQLVYSGNGGAAGQFDFDLNNCKPGEYHFYLRVSKDGIFKREYSDSIISYQSKDSKEKVKDVAGGKYNDGYYISWTNNDENEIHTVYVWDDKFNLIENIETGEGDILYYEDFEENAEKIYIAVVNNNNNCNYDKIEVSKDTVVDAAVTYDVTENATNHRFIVASVEFKGKCTIDAYLNDNLLLEDETEVGEYKVTMSDGDNEIQFLVTDEKGNVITFTKNIYVDSIAPALSVSEDIDNTVTAKDYVYVSGYSEAGATLTLNGNEVKMKKGYFNEKVELKYGKNNIELIARDIAGNESKYNATVNYELSKKNRTQLYIIAGLVIVLVIVYLVVFIKGFKRRRKKEKKAKQKGE